MAKLSPSADANERGAAIKALVANKEDKDAHVQLAGVIYHLGTTAVQQVWMFIASAND
jgi:hypothetical protein